MVAGGWAGVDGAAVAAAVQRDCDDGGVENMTRVEALCALGGVVNPNP